MTLEKVFYLIIQGIYGVFDSLGQCVISINGAVDISLGELIIGSIILLFVIKVVSAFAWGS